VRSFLLSKMARTIDMQQMRYINLFSKVSHIIPKCSFKYNNQLIFLVPRASVSQAIGKDAINVKKMSTIMAKKVKIIAFPKFDDEGQMAAFIERLTSPAELIKVELREDSLIINANRVNKANLIGRNRGREQELNKIMKDFFNLSLRIV